MVVAYFGDDSRLMGIFTLVARQFNDNINFVTCSTQECFNYFMVREGQIIIFKKFDEKRNDLNEKFTEKTLKDFISRNSVPLISYFNGKVGDLVFGNNNPAIFLFRDHKHPTINTLENTFRSAGYKIVVSIIMILLG